jgi:TetR/AcrR family transcriptional regulator, transcriptional repressor for nem operon
MGHSQADKALSRERILREAAKQIRDAGLESVSVGRLMRSVGLTHGGFYNHFESRSELLALALERALIEGRKPWLASENLASKPHSFETLVRKFLSRAHRNSRMTGCAVAAMASDVTRADESSRAVMSKYVNDFFSQMSTSMSAPDDEDAMLAVSAMVGALLLSRVLVDPNESDALLKVVKDKVIALNLVDSE